jgi:hypothetical protein
MLWIGAFVAALPIINPVMVANIEIISFALANVLYGLTLGWWIDRTPMIHKVTNEVPTPEVPTSTKTTEHPHEVVWPEWVYPYPAGAIGGLLGGVAVALVGMSYSLFSGLISGNVANIWLPVNVVAAVVLRDMQTRSPEELSQFNLLALVTGTVIHLLIAVGLGEIFSFILPALPGRPLYWGVVIGPMLWIGAFVAALPIINPVMVANIEIISFTLANVLYGLTLGWWIDRTPMIHVED